MEKKTMLLIFNPKAGLQRFSAQLFEVVDKFTAAGFLVTVYPTQFAGEAKDVLIHCARDYDYVVCSGGDGTVSEVIDSLLMFEHHPTLGVIPAGTVNDFATSLGISRNILAATHIITSGEKKPLDIGRFGGVHFSYVAAFGIFTDVPYATPQSTKNILGSFAYYLEGIKRAASVKSFHCEFEFDEEVLAGEFVLGIVSNAHSVAGMKLPRNMAVSMDDGLFEVILLRKPESLLELQEVAASMISQEIRSDLLTVRKAARVNFSSQVPVAWTLDGDFGGEHTQVVIENRRHAIDIMMPS